MVGRKKEPPPATIDPDLEPIDSLDLPVKERANGADQMSRLMIYDGCNVSQLAEMFKMDPRTIQKKIRALKPAGKRAGFPIWRIRDVAPYLVEPKGNIEEKIKTMNHRDLPPMLLKEFWAGQNARLKFEEEQGDLWRTDKVLEHYAQAFKTMRTEILLVADAVDRTAEMSDRQRGILRKMMDGLLKNLRTALVDQFKHEPDRDYDAERGHSSSDSVSGEDGRDSTDPAAGL
jgi:hypothetical protein